MSSSSQPMSTPTKASAAPIRDSPGNWNHPRLAEITRRRKATTFNDKNIGVIYRNVLAVVAFVGVVAFASRWFPAATAGLKGYSTYAYLLLLLPAINITIACLPLVRRNDDISDIPLTPGQRKLLGLPQASGPPTPGSVYSTPPRYSRTPSLSGSTGKRSFSSSPLGSPVHGAGSGGNMGGFGSQYSPAGSPLLQKAVNCARRSSLGSFGPATPLGGGLGASNASLFGGLDSPSPSPAGGKKSSVTVNSKWLFEKGRKSSGSGWPQS